MYTKKSVYYSSCKLFKYRTLLPSIGGSLKTCCDILQERTVKSSLPLNNTSESIKLQATVITRPL